MPHRAATSTTQPTSYISPNAKSTHEPATFTDALPLPQLLVFDLDYTLWPFWIDTHVTPPLRPLTGTKAGTGAKDRCGGEYGFYPGVLGVLAACWRMGIKVAAASRTYTPELAGELLGMLNVDVAVVAAEGHGEQEQKTQPQPQPQTKKAKDLFANLQIYPGSKVKHMTQLQKALGVEFDQMVFFDDEARNRDTERELGVHFVLVRDGVDAGVVDEGIRAWRKKMEVSGGVGKSGEGKGKVVEVEGKV